MAINYEYISYRFERNSTEPVTEIEYGLIKSDLYGFMDEAIITFEKHTKGQLNLHKFNWKLFLIMISIGILLFLISFGLEHLKYPGVAEIFSMLIIIPVFAVFFQPIQYIMSAIKSESSKTSYQEKLKLYYKFHHMKLKDTVNYSEYLELITDTTDKEYLRFILKQVI